MIALPMWLAVAVFCEVAWMLCVPCFSQRHHADDFSLKSQGRVNYDIVASNISKRRATSYASYVKHLLLFTCNIDRHYHNDSNSNPQKQRCAYNRNSSHIYNTQAIMMNMSSFATYVDKQREDECSVVLFYATWCPFSMKMTQNYNALGRIFTNIDVVAVDVVTQTNSFMTKYGTVAVPMLLLFQGGRVVSSYTLPNTTLPALLEYVARQTKLSIPQHADSYDVIAAMEGPVPVALLLQTNWVLIGSVAFLILFSAQQILVRKWQNLADIGNAFR